jgi:hypothetical protein
MPFHSSPGRYRASSRDRDGIGDQMRPPTSRKGTDDMTEPDIVKEREDIEALFVQTALAANLVDGRIVWKDVTPSTL